MSFSIIPTESKTISQLRSLNKQSNSKVRNGRTKKINPLEFFKIKDLNRSDYFSTGNYPLNSIFQIIILSNFETNVSGC